MDAACLGCPSQSQLSSSRAGPCAHCPSGMLAVSASSSFHYCGAGARAQIQTSLYPAIPPANHRSVSGAPNGHAPARHTCSTNFPARSPGARPALPRAMALPRAALGQPPFSPCPARPASCFSTSTTGSGPSLACSRTQHPGEQSRRAPFRSRAVSPCSPATSCARALMSFMPVQASARRSARTPGSRRRRGAARARRTPGSGTDGCRRR